MLSGAKRSRSISYLDAMRNIHWITVAYLRTVVVPSHLTAAVVVLRPQAGMVRTWILGLVEVDVELVAVQDDQLFAPISSYIGDVEPVGLLFEVVEESDR